MTIKELEVLSWKIVIITITKGVSQKKKTDQSITLQFQKQRKRKLNKYEVIKSVTKYLVFNLYKIQKMIGYNHLMFYTFKM